MKPYRVTSFYDTETTNIRVGEEWHAYPILYIHNRITCDIENYRLGCDDVCFSRDENGFFRRLEGDIDAGLEGGFVPVVCAYNLAFDLQPILERLAHAYDLEVMARSSTSVYTLDLKENGATVLRFWDTSFLEPRGLAAMGKSCGVAKASGGWDYSLIRTPSTPLTDEELGYAKRDVQVIPAYLAALLKSYPDICPDELGVKVLTKTSLVRVTAREQVGPLEDGSRKLADTWRRTCEVDRAKTYEEHAARMSCFRGGLTFTAASNACQVFDRCASFDTVSMHHLFINGRYTGRVWHKVENGTALAALERVKDTSIQDVLDRYHNPFGVAFHAHVIIKGLRLKAGSVFEHEGIGLLARSKFTATSHKIAAPREATADTALRVSGYRDRAYGAVFAFGKLMSANVCGVWVSELEWWNVCRVYDFESYEVDWCETAGAMMPPPPYVSLQSSMLYELKRNCKQILESYTPGEPYTGWIHADMPQGYREALEAGTMDAGELATYYKDHVKGMYNGIYGTQAQNELKPEYMAGVDGELEIDPATVLTPENFKYRKPHISKVMYPYGLRIVGGSRMHLVIALELIWGELAGRVHVLGGDTDSIKLSMDEGVTVENVLEALKPLHLAVDAAMSEAQAHIRQVWPERASTFDAVGHFECDGEYDLEVDLWNKCRVTYKAGKGFGVTCAGLRQVKEGMSITRVLERYADRHGERAAMGLFGYDTELSYSICRNIQHSRPKTSAVVDLEICDYRGDTSHVSAHESVALYPSSKVFGALDAQVNYESWLWMNRHGIEVRDARRVIAYDEKRDIIVVIDGEDVITTC